MKNLQKTLFLLLLSFICSCTSDEQFQDFSNVKDPTKVTAILPDWNLEDEDSRTSITTGNYPTAPSPVWVTGDSIGIYPDTGGDQLSFRINEGGSKTCTFDGGGWAMKSASYTAYSPFKRGYYYEEKDALPISMLGQTQNGNDNADHLGAYDIQIAKGEKPESGGLVFEFSRKVALVRLEITAPKAATWISVSIESDALFTTEAKMNLKLGTPTVTPITTSNSVTLNLENVSTTNDNLSIIAYMMLLPVDLTGKTLSVKLTDSESKTYITNGTITNNKTNFAANAARWISAVFEETIPNNQIWYTSSDGNIVTPIATTNFGANIVSNVYKNGKGIITFDGDVSQIGKLAFRAYTSLTDVTIPNSVNSIEENAFIGCKSLTNIKIPNSVTNIGNNAFSTCTSLENITIPNSVTNVGENAFGSCSSLLSIIVEAGNPIYDSRENCNAIIETASNTLISGCKNTIIPNSVTSIGDNAFWNISSLTNIVIPDNVTNIGDNAFYRCNLTTITIPNSVTSIGNNTFGWCSLTNITIPNSIISIGENAFEGCKFTDFIIPNSITKIGDGTFSSCSSLTNITIPNSVTNIGNFAFSSCRALENITIPNSVTTIGNNAFYNCTSLTRVFVKSTIPPAISGDTFNYCNNDLKIYVPSESIEAYRAADYWKHLNLIETISDNQIWYTTEQGNTVTPYKTDAFGVNIISNVYKNGKGIITFDGALTNIGEYAFKNCGGMVSITLPSSVTSIGKYAFQTCNAYMIYIKATTPPVIYDSSFNIYFTLHFKVPTESVEAYKKAGYGRSGWSLSADDE